MAKEYSLGNPLEIVGWIRKGEEIPHWGMALLGWLSMYNAVMGDCHSKAREVYQKQVGIAIGKRTPQVLRRIYEEWGKSLK